MRPPSHPFLQIPTRHLQLVNIIYLIRHYENEVCGLFRPSLIKLPGVNSPA
jgi:hypothetical protein